MKTWAMLDNWSQGNFVKNNLVKEFEVHGINKSVTIKALKEDFKNLSMMKKP